MVELSNKAIYANLETATPAEPKIDAADKLVQCCQSSPSKLASLNFDVPVPNASGQAGWLPNLALDSAPLQNLPGISGQSKDNLNALSTRTAPEPLFNANELTFQDMKGWALKQTQNLSTNDVMAVAFFGRLKFYSRELDANLIGRIQPVSNVAGAMGAWALYHDGKALLNSKTGADIAYHAATSASDLAITGGAIFNNVPSLRKYAASALALGLTSRFVIPVVNHVYNWGAGLLNSGK